MKKFITECGVFFALMLAIFIVAIISIKPDPDNYLYESKAKLNMLRTAKQPRVIFVGGSNLAFGLNSKEISDSLHKNVINNGLHAGLGLKFIIDDIDEYLKSGDCVVICPEYSHFFGNAAYGEPATSLTLAEYRHDVLAKCNGEQLRPIISGLPKVFINRIQAMKKREKKARLGDKPVKTYEYRKSGFNEYGDEVSHWTLKSGNPKISVSKITGDFNEDFYQYFLSVVRSWEQRGVSVIMMPPAIYDKQYDVCHNEISRLSKRLQADGHPFKAETSLFAYPDSLMFDTPYHINKKGVDKRTRDVIKALR